VAPGGCKEAARRLDSGLLPGAELTDGAWWEGMNCQAVKLQWWNFVFLAYEWVAFDSIVLHPTFHSCKHLFQAFPTLTQAFTLKQNIQFTKHMHNLT